MISAERAGRLGFTRRLRDRRIGTYVPNGRSHHGLGQQAQCRRPLPRCCRRCGLSLWNFKRILESVYRPTVPISPMGICQSVVTLFEPTSPLILNNSHWIPSSTMRRGRCWFFRDEQPAPRHDALRRARPVPRRDITPIILQSGKRHPDTPVCVSEREQCSWSPSSIYATFGSSDTLWHYHLRKKNGSCFSVGIFLASNYETLSSLYFFFFIFFFVFFLCFLPFSRPACRYFEYLQEFLPLTVITASSWCGLHYTIYNSAKNDVPLFSRWIMHRWYSVAVNVCASKKLLMNKTRRDQ